MLTCSLAHLLTCSPAHLLTYSLTHLLTHSFRHSLTCLLTQVIDPRLGCLSAAGGDAIRQVPALRWDASDHVSAQSYGGFIHGAQAFDASFFRTSPVETAAMDPQQRLLLEFGYAAMHNAGQRRDGLRDTNRGIFLAIMNTDFAGLQEGNDSVYAATGSTISIAAGRLSYALGLQGMCVSVDTVRGARVGLRAHAHMPTCASDL